MNEAGLLACPKLDFLPAPTHRDSGFADRAIEMDLQLRGQLRILSSITGFPFNP